MMSGRFKDWEARFAAFLSTREAMPFQWGVQDCCRFACDGLEVQGFPHLMADVRRYTTDKGAAAMLRRFEGSLDRAADHFIAAGGFQHEVAVPFAQRGSMVLADVVTPWGTTEPALGLVGLDGITTLFAGPNGLVRRSVSGCRRAWISG